MSDTLIAQAARRAHYDAKVGQPDFAFKMALANLLADIDNHEDDHFVMESAETLAKEYVYLSDKIDSVNQGVLL